MEDLAAASTERPQIGIGRVQSYKARFTLQDGLVIGWAAEIERFPVPGGVF